MMNRVLGLQYVISWARPAESDYVMAIVIVTGIARIESRQSGIAIWDRTINTVFIMQISISGMPEEGVDMKATGIVRRVDDLGRIVIPKTVRRSMGIVEGTPLELFTEKGALICKKYVVENELGDMVGNLMETVEDMCVDLGSEKTEYILRHIHEIENLLKQGK